MIFRSALTLVLLLAPAVCGAAFTDVSADYESAGAIGNLEQKGVVQGYEDGSYRPYATINRAEFTKILMKVAEDLPRVEFSVIGGEQCLEEWRAFERTYGRPVFRDVSETAWYAVPVCQAWYHDVISGDTDPKTGDPIGMFRPGDTINLAEAAKIFQQVFGLDDTVYPNREWYTGYVCNLADVHAVPLTLREVEQHINRGEMAEIIDRLMLGDRDRASKTCAQLTGVNAYPPCVVGGCSGQLCIEEGEDGVSTCEWRSEYLCYRSATCERQADGACGWTQTSQLRGCLSQSQPRPME